MYKVEMCLRFSRRLDAVQSRELAVSLKELLSETCCPPSAVNCGEGSTELFILWEQLDNWGKVIVSGGAVLCAAFLTEIGKRIATRFFESISSRNELQESASSLPIIEKGSAGAWDPKEALISAKAISDRIIASSPVIGYLRSSPDISCRILLTIKDHSGNERLVEYGEHYEEGRLKDTTQSVKTSYSYPVEGE